MLRWGAAVQQQSGESALASMAAMASGEISGPYRSSLGTDFHELARPSGILTTTLKIAPQPKASNTDKFFGLVPDEPSDAPAADRQLRSVAWPVSFPAERRTAFEARAPPTAPA